MHDDRVKVHLGAFDQILPGWINTDVTPHLRVARVPGLARLLRLAGKMSEERYRQHRAGIFRQLRRLDVTRRFPFPDGSVAAIYSSHMLEHLYADKALHCLGESYRVLAPGGVCRIAVPDLDEVVRSYDRSNPELFLDGIFEGRQAADKNRHHWHYNETSLRKILVGIGFREAVRCTYRQGRCPDVERIDFRPESLFMEGIK